MTTSDPRSGLRTAVLLVLLGAVLLLVSTAGTWVEGVVEPPAPLPAQDVDADAAEAAGALRALGLVALAGVPALVATRGRGRPLLGVVLLLVGAGALAGAVAVLADPAASLPPEARDARSTFQPLLAVLGAVVTAGAGGLTVARGRRWAGLSQRFEAPAASAPGRPAVTAPGPSRGGAPDDDAPVEEAALWAALDRGDDPTGAGEATGQERPRSP